MPRPRVFVALSGGVDSSVAAALLKERGFDVSGIHMKMWAPLEARANGAAAAKDGWPLTGWAPDDRAAVNNLSDRIFYSPIGRGGSDEHSADEYSAGEAVAEQTGSVCRQQYQDRLDATRVAARLGIHFQTWDFSEEYRQAVIGYMIREYAGGRTPNPDVMCNRHIKFGMFLQRALEEGADYIATGHYVHRREVKSQKSKVKSYALAQARDLNKDQSYFLWTFTRAQLRHCLFPIGEYTKPEVRELARKFGLPTAEKPDSQGLCFVGEINMRDFLKRHIPERRGRVLTTAGRAVGEHDGTAFYTIGQREGLGIGGGIPYYVAAKEPAANTLIVAEGPYDERLFQSSLTAVSVNWISGREPALPLTCQARIRYRQPLQRCTVQIGETDESASGLDETATCSPSEAIRRAKRSRDLIVTFDEPQRAVTPGQSVVFYRGGKMLGGGIISKLSPELARPMEKL